MTDKFFSFCSCNYLPSCQSGVGSERTAARVLSCCLGGSCHIWSSSCATEVPSVSAPGWLHQTKTGGQVHLLSPLHCASHGSGPEQRYGALLGNTALAHRLCQGAQRGGHRSCASSGRCQTTKVHCQAQQPPELTGCPQSWELSHQLNNKATCSTYNFLLGR